MLHDHAGHSHDHLQDLQNYNRRFSAGIALNLLFVCIEAGFGWFAGSLALIADAGHNLSDVLSLVLAWGAMHLASKSPTKYRTYGFKRVTIMASLVSAVFLLFAMGAITWEAVGRFFNPGPLKGAVVITVAAIGVGINALTALLFISGQKYDLNIRGAFLHMAADAGLSFGVAVAGAVIVFTGWLWVDPVISLVIVAIILIGTWGLLKDSFNLSIDAVPRGIDMKAVKDYLTGIDGVCSIHDLHVWALSTTETALTVHMITTHEPEEHNSLLTKIQKELNDRFGIHHATIQLETQGQRIDCRLNESGLR